jgi:hypothetical protein
MTDSWGSGISFGFSAMKVHCLPGLCRPRLAKTSRPLVAMMAGYAQWSYPETKPAPIHPGKPYNAG